MRRVGQPGEGTIDVLMVAHRDAGTIATRVKDLGRHDLVAAVIVVDHGDDGSAELAEGAGAVVAHDPSNPGLGAGMNRAARFATADFLLLIDPDVELEDGALEVGVAALAARPMTAAVQGTITTSAGRPQRDGGREIGPLALLGRAANAEVVLRFRPVAWLAARLPAISHRADTLSSTRKAVETLAGDAILIRRDAFDSVDGFDEQYLLDGGILDLCRRLRHEGWELQQLPVPWAHHRGGASAADGWERELRWWEGTLAVAARGWSTRRFRAAQAAGALMFVRLVVAEPRRSSESYQALVGTPRRLRSERERGR